MISPSELAAFVRETYAASDTAYAMSHGGRVPQRLFLAKAYPLTFVTLAPGLAQPQQLTMTASGDFFLTRIDFSADNAAASQTSSTVIVPNWTLQIVDSGSDENYFAAPAEIHTVANNARLGNAERFDLPFPRIISGGSNVTLTATSYEAANTYSVRMTLWGVLVKTIG